MAYSATNSSPANSPVSLTLQSLIDVRHDVVRNRSITNIGRSDFPGQRTGSRRGRGLEFIDLRQYNPSDDIRHIDWNVTARSNEPYTRLYREEREHITTVVVDLRPLMFTGSNCLRAVSAGENAARVLWQANESGDRCAAMIIHAFGIEQTRPIAGTKGVLSALECIAQNFAATRQLLAGTKPAGGNTPAILSDALTLITNARGKSGSYFFISGFDTEDDRHWSDVLPATAAMGQLRAILLIDSIERTSLPAGSYQYRTRKEKLTTRINNSNRPQLDDELALSVARRQAQFTAANVPLLSIDTALPGAEFLAEILRMRLL